MSAYTNGRDTLSEKRGKQHGEIKCLQSDKQTDEQTLGQADEDEPTNTQREP